MMSTMALALLSTHVASMGVLATFYITVGFFMEVKHKNIHDEHLKLTSLKVTAHVGTVNKLARQRRMNA